MNELLNREIILQINADCYMKMTAERPVQDLCLCDCADLIVHHPQVDNLCIKPWSSIKTIFDILTTMRFCFEAALEGKLKLIPLPCNIGYINCEYVHLGRKDYLPYHELINRYLLMDSPRFTATWLYEIDGSFFIEVTPLYPWAFCDPQPGEQYISYEEFMASYKSMLTIPLQCADIERLYQKTSQLADEMLARERKQSGFDITHYIVHEEAKS